jgi:putative tryptophan/tyrosine transport system substrate-binding protein
MQRREFIALVGGAAVAWPRAARAQQIQVRRIAMLLPGSEADARDQIMAFRQGLEKFGWNEGRNIRLDYRYAAGDLESMRIHAAELLTLRPDVIVTASNQITTIMSRQTKTIPIVFASANDPLETGLVPNMARPGGNITGFILYEVAIGGKWVEILREAAPSLTHLAVLNTPAAPTAVAYLQVIETAGRSLGLQVTSMPARDLTEIERSIKAFARQPNGGLIVQTNPIMNVNASRIAALASQHRIPAIYGLRASVTNGGLMSYTVNTLDLYPRAAGYVDRILRGEKPGDLPVQAPTKFELVVNLKAAKAIGLTIPKQFLLRADEVIE